MADVAEFTALEAATGKPAAASHPENTNKFQHAISAWRSRYKYKLIKAQFGSD